MISIAIIDLRRNNSYKRDGFVIESKMQNSFCKLVNACTSTPIKICMQDNCTIPTLND